MQFSESRRRFLQSFFPKTDGDSTSTQGLDSRVNDADSCVQDGRTVSRRDALKVFGAELTGALATLMSPTDPAEARDRPPSLVGTPASLDKQVRIATKDGLSMLYEKDLVRNSFYRRDKRLVVVGGNSPHYYLDGVDSGNGISRPYVSLFLQILSEQFYKTFKDRLKVTGLTRSYEFQSKLRQTNGNATLPEKSAHVRGAGIDISYVPMDLKQRQWMRNMLVDLERRGYIEATEEITQPHFHIMVFKNYAKFVQRKLGMNDRDFAKHYGRVTGGRIY